MNENEQRAYLDGGGMTHLLEKMNTTNPATVSPSSISGTVVVDSIIPLNITSTNQNVVIAESRDENVITARANNNTITAIPVGTGETSIDVAIVGDIEYATKRFVIPVSISVIEPVSWTNSTDEEIINAIELADTGVIDLYEDMGWRVGDERSVNIDAIAATGTFDGVTWEVGDSHSTQTVTMVLMDRGSSQTFELVNPVLDRDGERIEPSFVVGLKHSLNDGGGYMNKTPNVAVSWDGCSRRNWCNGGFRKSLPEGIRSVFKEFKTRTIGTISGSIIETSQDYFSLFAEKEIFGQRYYSNANEADALIQIEYYKTSANRANYSQVWERSPTIYGTGNFCYVLNGGAQNSYSYISGNPGFAPFGVI